VCVAEQAPSSSAHDGSHSRLHGEAVLLVAVLSRAEHTVNLVDKHH
jgi:hypothetical protein